MDEAEEIRAAERAVREALMTGDAAADGAHLAEDFLGVHPDGFAGRAAHVAQLETGPSVIFHEIGEDHLRPLGPGHVLHAHRARVLRTGATQVEEMLVASIRERRQGGWIDIFSQDTPLTGVGVP